MNNPRAFWSKWLLTVSAFVGVFGFSMVLAPGVTLRILGLLLYSSAGALGSHDAGAVAYIRLAHAVLGSVMSGWAVAMGAISRGPFRRGDRNAWMMLAACLAAWFIPDTAFSLLNGFPRNALLNLGLAALFAVPLAASYPDFRRRRASAAKASR